MSILDTPRYNFTGIFYCNPCTANNDDVLPEVIDRDTNTLGASVQGHGDDDQIRDYLKETWVRNDYKKPDCHTFINSGWNPYGNHWCNFMDTEIRTGVTEVSASGPTPVPSSDPIIGMQVRLLGSKSQGGVPEGDPVMVDMDPTGLVTTQIWIGGIQIGDPNNGGVKIYSNCRAYQSWLNFQSTVIEGGYQGEQNFVGIRCMMQFTIFPCDIPNPSPSMPATLQKLLAEAQQNGLVCRFTLSEVEPGYTDVYMKPYLENNQRLANNAYGYMTGTIGVIKDFQEPRAEPEGRKIQTCYPRPDTYWANPSGAGQPQLVQGCDKAWEGEPALFGNIALITTTPGVVSIDMSSAFPKYGFRNPTGPVTNQPPEGFGPTVVEQAANVGDLQLCVTEAGTGTVYVIGTLDYGVGDYKTFRENGCIQDMTYTIPYETVRDGDLFIRGNPTGTNPLNKGLAVATEDINRLMITADSRACYMGAPGSSTLVGMRVRVRGLTPPMNWRMNVYIKEYMNIIQTDSPSTSCSDAPARPNQSTSIRTENCLSFPASISLGASASPTYIQARGIQAGVSMLDFQLVDEVRGSSVPAWSTCNYSTLRVYADDDYHDKIVAGNLEWDFVYEEVLRYYYVLFPAMSQYVKLNQRCAVYNARTQIRAMMAIPSLLGDFNRTQNMPVTRTLSPGKIRLLLAWLDQEEADPNSPCKNSS